MIINGEDIYQRRVALRRTQAQLAQAVGVSAAHISQLENGNTSLTRDMAVRLEAVLLTWEDAVPSKGRMLGQVIEELHDLEDQQVVEALTFTRALKNFD